MSSDPNTLFNHAFSVHQAGNVKEAISMYQQLLAQFPNEPQLLAFLGAAWLQLENFEEGARFLEKSLEICPDQEFALSNLGYGFQKLNRFDQALHCYDRAIFLKPDFVTVHNNRANLLKELNYFEEALAGYNQVLLLDPNFIDAYYSRGIVLNELNRPEEALQNYDYVISLKHDNINAYNNKGVILNRLRHFEEALLAWDHVISLDPNFADAYSNKSFALNGLKRFDEALLNCDHAIALNPTFVSAYVNKSFIKLILGDYDEGWKLYEWRWKYVSQEYVRTFEQPLWLGDSSISGKTILIYPEQGLGDVIQMCRYVPMLNALGAKVVLEVPSSLVSLMLTLKDDVKIIERGPPPLGVDVQCPIMSLPLALKSTVDNIPKEVPYLFSDPAKKKVWKERLGTKTKPRIGFVCSGSTTHNDDGKRSIPLHLFKALFKLPFEFHMLQKEIRSDDQKVLEEFPHIQIHHDNLVDFSDTAALIDKMDLVISVDTSVVHLAGALGKPVWVLISWVPDFRWLLDRTDTPWYPAATLFRQPELGNWVDVIEQVCQKLKGQYLNEC